MAARPIEELKFISVYEVKTRLKGALRSKFIADVERGEKPSDLLRQMAKFYYENRPSKNSY